MLSGPSTHYKVCVLCGWNIISKHYSSCQSQFARNPKAAIVSAVVDQINQKSTNPRVSWRFICTAAGIDIGQSLDIEKFTVAVKSFGTGIQLEPCDVQIAFDCDDQIDFALYSAFLEK